MNNQLVSICIPAFNSEKFIEQTLQCLCAQTYINIEIVLVNDGSIDNTLTIAKSINDKRIKIITVDNGGAAKARNIAYENCTGNYIIFFDVDDYVGTDFIEKQFNKINGKNDIVVLADWVRLYQNSKDILPVNRTPFNEMCFNEWIDHYWYNCNPMTNPGRAIIPRNLLNKIGLWNETLSLNDDLEFFSRLFSRAKKIGFNHDAVFYYRSGIDGLSGKKGRSSYESLYNSLLLSINIALISYPDKRSIKQSCANMWQSFIYIVYPNEKDLIEKVQEQINKLTPPDLQFESGGFTKLLAVLFGWKIAKNIKIALKGNSL